MTPQEAFDNQLIQQLGSACLTIAKQSAAVTDLQNQVEELKKEVESLKEPKCSGEVLPAEDKNANAGA